MKISEAHQKFAGFQHHVYDIPKQDVLTHPENYLGPNWEEVINFWLYIDTLSENQWLVVWERYRYLSVEECRVASGKVLVAAKATIRYAFDASHSASDSVSYANNTAFWATYELIGLQKLLEQGYQPVFFPLFLNL
jgi:hypothetical protein